MWKIPENVTRLIEGWKRGDSASVIGGILGCSRNAVISKIHRLGLSHDRVNVPLQARKPARPKPPKPPEPRFWPKIDKPVADRPAEPQRRSGNGVSILEAKWRQCRDVIDLHGSPEGLALFCGEPTVNDGPWCEYHHYRNTDQWRGRR